VHRFRGLTNLTQHLLSRFKRIKAKSEREGQVCETARINVKRCWVEVVFKLASAR